MLDLILELNLKFMIEFILSPTKKMKITLVDFKKDETAYLLQHSNLKELIQKFLCVFTKLNVVKGMRFRPFKIYHNIQ